MATTASSSLAIDVYKRQVLECLSSESIGVYYVYSFIRVRSEHALVLFKVDDTEKAIDILQRTDVPILCMDDIKKI